MTTGTLTETPAQENANQEAEATPEQGAENQSNVEAFNEALQGGNPLEVVQAYRALSQAERREVFEQHRSGFERFFSIVGRIIPNSLLALWMRDSIPSLLEQIRFADAAGILDGGLARDLMTAAGVTADDQLAVALDDAATTAVKEATGSCPIHTLFNQLVTDAEKFIDQAAGRSGTFADWLGSDIDVLKKCINALPEYEKWVAIFKDPHDAWDKLLEVICEETGGGDIWGWSMTDEQWEWLIDKCIAAGSVTDAQADVIYSIYNELIPLTTKRKIWEALYTVPLAPPGPYTYRSWPAAGTTWNLDDDRLGSAGWPKRGEAGYVARPAALVNQYLAVEPGNEAYDLFFTQFRQMPRAHINLASHLIMGKTRWIRWTITNPGGAVTRWENASGDKTLHNTRAAAESDASTSLYYGGTTNTILIKADGQATEEGQNVATPNNRAIPNVGVQNEEQNPLQRLANWWNGDSNFSNGTLPRAANGTTRDGTVHGPDTDGDGNPDELNYFQNHVTHEVGHAVGARNFTHRDAAGNATGSTQSGNSWAKDYGDWQAEAADNTTRDKFANQFGWNTAMDQTRTYVIDGTNVDIPGSEVKEFFWLTAQGKAGDATLSKADDGAGNKRFGSAGDAKEALRNYAGFNWAGTKIFQYLDRYSVGSAFRIPQGFSGGDDRVYFWCTRKSPKGFASYKRQAYYTAVSHYELSSVNEMFAELYTAWFNGNHSLPTVNGKNANSFFQALERAQPGDFQAPGSGAVSLGDGEGNQQGDFPSELEDPVTGDPTDTGDSDVPPPPSPPNPPPVPETPFGPA